MHCEDTRPDPARGECAADGGAFTEIRAVPTLRQGAQDRLIGAASPVIYLAMEVNVGGRCGAMQ